MKNNDVKSIISGFDLTQNGLDKIIRYVKNVKETDTVTSPSIQNKTQKTEDSLFRDTLKSTKEISNLTLEKNSFTKTKEKEFVLSLPSVDIMGKSNILIGGLAPSAGEILATKNDDSFAFKWIVTGKQEIDLDPILDKQDKLFFDRSAKYQPLPGTSRIMNKPVFVGSTTPAPSSTTEEEIHLSPYERDIMASHEWEEILKTNQVKDNENTIRRFNRLIINQYYATWIKNKGGEQALRSHLSSIKGGFKS